MWLIIEAIFSLIAAALTLRKYFKRKSFISSDCSALQKIKPNSIRKVFLHFLNTVIDIHKLLKDMGVNMKRSATFIECTSLAKEGAEKMGLGARFQKLRRGLNLQKSRWELVFLQMCYSCDNIVINYWCLYVYSKIRLENDSPILHVRYIRFCHILWDFKFI